MVKTDTFRGRDYLTMLDYTREELETYLKLAEDLKLKFATGQSHRILRDKTLFMVFYNQSLRTRNSFEAGMTQLGGHAHFLDPGKIYSPALEGDEEAYKTERISDVARVLARMGHGIAIRIYGGATGWIYGKGTDIEENFAYWTKHDTVERHSGKARAVRGIPVINMECDKYHPCQGLADIMTVREKFGANLRGKRFVMSWAYSGSVKKPLSVPHSAIVAAAKFGMDVTLAYPKGFELDEEIVNATKKTCEANEAEFDATHDFDGAIDGGTVIYPKSWGTKQHFADPVNAKPADFEAMEALFSANKEWMCTEEHMASAANDAIYMHCLPADRGMEVDNAVIDGPQSVVFDEAENRMHAQKAVMALNML